VCAGRRVDVGGGPAAGGSTTTDGAGYFNLPNLQAAGFSLWFTRPGYEIGEFRIGDYPRDAVARVSLTPRTRIIEQVWAGKLSDQACSGFGFQSLSLPLRVDGVLQVAEGVLFTVEPGILRLMRNGVEVPGTTCGGTRALQYDVSPGEYEVRLSGYGCPTTRLDGSFRVVFTRPQ
jgi:hypothetical protein